MKPTSLRPVISHTNNHLLYVSLIHSCIITEVDSVVKQLLKKEK